MTADLLYLRTGNTQMNEQWILTLIAEGEPEGQRLDFKRRAPTSDERDLKSFLVDVCALANAQGGAVVYGIEQTLDGRAKEVVGLDGNLDELAMRLQTKAGNHIYPRVTGLSLQPIHTKLGSVLVASVPEQYEAPFEVSLADWRRFPVRTGTKNSDMDYRQLSNAFLGRQNVVERLTTWRQSRCKDVSKRSMERSERLAFLQLVPLSAFASNNRPDLALLRSEPLKWNRNLMNIRYNVYGLVMVLGQPLIHPPYDFVQWHRSGAVDAAWQVTMTGSKEGKLQTRKSVERMHDLLPQISQNLQKAGVSGPALLSISLFNIRDHCLYFDDEDGCSAQTQVIEESTLDLEPEFIGDLQVLQNDPLPFVRRLMDQMFQSFGEDRCPHFARSGELRVTYAS